VSSSADAGHDDALAMTDRAAQKHTCFEETGIVLSAQRKPHSTTVTVG